MDRREFLRLAAGAAALTACGPNSKNETKVAPPRVGDRSLRIALWKHFIPDYDPWFDEEYTRRWGEKEGVDVVVDHISYPELGARAGAEVAAGKGHDLFAFITPPAAFEDDVIDHREIAEEVTAKVGKMAPIVERSVFNPRTGKHFGFPQFWVPNPVHYRADLWHQVRPGLVPDSWEDVLEAAPHLKAMGRPVGIALSEDDDANFSLFSLLMAFGAHLQDEDGRVTLDRRQTIEAVKLGAAIYRSGMTDEVFYWDSSSNNRALATGQSALVLNAISAIRDAEESDDELAANIALAPAMAGPGSRLGVNSVVQIFVIWRFARNIEVAKRFLVDLAVAGREDFLRSRFYNLPAFPDTVPDLTELVATDDGAQPADKYALLADAHDWTTNIGHPGPTNAAVDEVFFQYVIPKMFAAAAKGELSAEEAVKRATADVTLVFDKWRERGKI